MHIFASFIDFVLGVVLICIFIGVFMRLGRIENILRKTAIHQGAMEEVEKTTEGVYGGGPYKRRR